MRNPQIVALARDYNYKVEREPGDLRKWPEGAPPPLGPPPPVGSCLVHAIDPLITLYEVKEGARSVALLTLDSIVLRITGFSVDDVSVGTPAAEVIARYPSDRFRLSCRSGRFGTACGFEVIGQDAVSAATYYVDGVIDEQIDQLQGPAAAAFLEGKLIRGIEINAPSRL